MVRAIFRCLLLVSMLFSVVFAKSSLINEILNSGNGHGCNTSHTECWNVDWTGEEKFIFSPSMVKGTGVNGLQGAACQRIIEHYIDDSDDAFKANALLLKSINNLDKIFKEEFKDNFFRVFSYKNEINNKFENITICEVEHRYPLS